MYTQFFGNFLLSHNYVNKAQLISAMKRQSNEHMKLGTLAIHAGYMSASEVDSIVVMQTHQDRKFGELAVEQGLLTNEQVISLLKTQGPDFLLLGQILVDDNVLTNQDLENIITDYRSQNELYDLDLSDITLNQAQKLFENFFVKVERPITSYGKMYMELLFNNLIRFVGDDFTPLEMVECPEFPTTRCSTQKVCGKYSLQIYLDMDEETAIEFASKYVGDRFDTYDEYVEASMDDFLNLHNGLFAVNVSNETSCELTLTAPEKRDNSLLVFDEGRTYILPILYSFGTIHILLQIFNQEDE